MKKRNIIPIHEFNPLNIFIATTFDTTAQAIMNKKSTDRKLCDARRVMAYILCRMYLMTLQEAGKKIGTNNHATVLRSLRRFDELFNSDKDFTEKTKACISFAKTNFKDVKCPFCSQNIPAHKSIIGTVIG